VGLAAVFVDAGYLFSGGSDVLFGGSQRRESLRLLEPDGLIAEIISQAATALDDPALRVLRTYWYDGARNGVPAPEQVAIGSLPKVKLRLGRVTGSGQKGVDGLIIIDLLNLSTHRAVDIAILFSGDEDLREAALFAQTHGVTVVLIGLPPTQRQRQSTLLIRESDHHVVLAPAVMSRHLERLEATTAPQAGTLPATVTATATAREPEIESSPPTETDEVAVDRGSADSLVDSSLESLLGVAEGVVGDRRFQAGGLIDAGPPQRLSKEADRLLVGRLAELTGVFPVDRELLQRVRRMCLDLASGPADPAPPT
jgi:uncharacterized LabA/DUF88 family protein